jgi:hypothetical protein
MQRSHGQDGGSPLILVLGGHLTGNGREGMNEMLVPLALVLLCTPAAGQEQPWAGEVLAIDDRRLAALRSSDATTLERIYADDYTLVTTSGGIRRKADQLNDLRSGTLRYIKTEILERQVRFYGDTANTAL